MQETDILLKTKSPAVGQVHGLGSKSPSTSPSKKRLRKLRRSDISIDWKRRETILSLFKAVVAKEPYLKTNNADKNKAWTDAKDMLFQQDFMAEYYEQKDSETMLRNMKVYI